MTLFRVQHNKNYTCINNTIATDTRISWKAKGLWFYAFSRPDDWTFYLQDLINQSTDGRDKVREGLKELEKTGYLMRSKEKDSLGRFICEWQFFETPQKIKNIPTTTDYPSTENPSTDKRPLLSTDKKLSTERKQQQAAPAAAVFLEIQKDSRLKKDWKWFLSFPPEKVEAAIKHANAMEAAGQIKKSFAATVKWILNEEPELNEVVDIEANKKFAEHCEKNGISNNFTLEALSKSAIISPKSGQALSVELFYDKRNFQAKLVEEMNKAKFRNKK